MSSGIKVFAPASVANVAIGFDCLGFALEQPGDEIVVKLVDKPGLKITKITGAKGRLPYEVHKNTAGYAAQTFLEHIGESGIGIEMEIRKKMPFGSGLGSSAASAVAGVFAVNELLKRPLQKRELLPFALKGEALASGSEHADNVAPSLLGGMILVRDHATLDVHRLHLPTGLYVTVIHPHIEILTKAAREILEPTVALSDAIQQTANMGAFVTGLFTSNFDLIGRSLQDVLIEPQRAKLIPQFDEIKQGALEAGALGCSISGAGPSIFALSANSLKAERVGEVMKKIYHDAKISATLFQSRVNQEGAIRF